MATENPFKKKMVFISPRKHFSLSAYLIVFRKARLISKFMTSQPGQQTIAIHMLVITLGEEILTGRKFGGCKRIVNLVGI